MSAVFRCGLCRRAAGLTHLCEVCRANPVVLIPRHVQDTSALMDRLRRLPVEAKIYASGAAEVSVRIACERVGREYALATGGESPRVVLTAGNGGLAEVVNGETSWIDEE